MESRFLICSCFFYKHIFLQRYRIHVDFHSQEQFTRDYGKMLKERGCDENDFSVILQDIRSEITRRKNRDSEHVQKCQLVKEKYHCLHPSVYILTESFLDSGFLEIVRYCKSPIATQEGLLNMVTAEKGSRVFSFPVFTERFCKLLLEELDNFEQSEQIPKTRPNTMNNTGILLSELGMDKQFLDPLLLDYLNPLARLLYPECVGSGLDTHRSHIVTYSTNSRLGDVGLSYHYDNAEVTLNVCLGKQFTEGELFFGDMKDDHVQRSSQMLQTHIYTHKVTGGVLHRGQQMHGALEIADGERYNLIMWMRASSVRNSLCPRCGESPSLVPSRGYGDGFTRLPTNSS